ncbi:MAG: hypothetical protein NO130_05350 [Sulfolobales archaeon]|nr:hypothetical protein [Sulfolobales archaeon]
MGALKYAIIGVVVAVVVVIALALILQTPHRAPVQYFGSPSGYEAFVPNGQTINYNGNTDPTGTLILSNGTEIKNVIWDGQYASTIIQNHNQIVQLNSRFVGQTDPINGQQYVPLQDLYVIKGQVPIEQVTINGQTYYVIDANNINPADIAGFYTYQGWVTNFVEAMNTPGTYAAGLPGNSPVFQWTNITGTLPYQIILYTQNCQNCAGGGILVLPNENIIPYGIFNNPFGSSFNYLLSSRQLYTPPS